VCEIAVGRHHQQPATVGVEPPHRDESGDGFDEIHDRAALKWVAPRGHDADRLVEDECDSNCLGGNAIPVDAHPIPGRVHEDAEWAHLAVDGDSTGGDQRVSAAT
jgi:hypothetical protein